MYVYLCVCTYTIFFSFYQFFFLLLLIMMNAYRSSDIMVAPHVIGEMIRSYVRTSAAGSEVNTIPQFCDLAKVANLAARIQIPTSASPATNIFGLFTHSEQKKNKRKLKYETQTRVNTVHNYHKEVPILAHYPITKME